MMFRHSKTDELNLLGGDMNPLTQLELERRKNGQYANFPTEIILDALNDQTSQLDGGHGGSESFASIEAIARRGSQELHAARQAKLPQTLSELMGLKPYYDAEHRAVRDHAMATGLITDRDQFTQLWREGGCVGGAEHEVYLSVTDNRIHKRNHKNYPMGSIGDAIQRMRVHNAIFPNTEYRLEGIQVGDNGCMWLHVSQDRVVFSGYGSDAEVESMMIEKGFERVPLMIGKVTNKPNAYYHEALGILIYDMHTNNILKGDDGGLYVIDPMVAVVRDGSWAACKLAAIDRRWPKDDAVF
jgi:hypothetical protein